MRGPRSDPSAGDFSIGILARPGPALLGLAIFALALRLVKLGARLAHQDEARVAHWILHYMAVDAWEYRAIIHGPFLPHVNGTVFSLLGPSDFTMRLVVAIIGGLLPLSAWLLRDRLRDVEVIGVGVLLALNPVLLYYSRFMRNDLPLAALAFATVAIVVRAIDTGRREYLLGAGVLFGLAMTTKESVILYPIAWGGALLLLFDHRLFFARYDDASWLGVAKREGRRTIRAILAWRYAILGGLGVVAVLALAFYAPKPDLYRAFADPARVSAVLDAATFGTWEKFTDLWGSTDMQEHSYPKFLGHLLLVMGVGGATTSVFAIIGFLADRYRPEGPRDIVAFSFYWGAASVVGYPVVVDIMSGWTAVHALAPLTIPAGVGLAVVLGTARRAYARQNTRILAVSVVLLLAAATATVGGAVAINYAYPTHPDNPVVQYAQPSGNMKPTLAEIEDLSARNGDGPDVLFYGEEFYSPNESETQPQLDIEDGGYPGWFARLPLPWYLDRYDANVTSTETPGTVDRLQPPVVIALEEDADDVRNSLSGYREVTHQGYLYGRPIVFFLQEESQEEEAVDGREQEANRVDALFRPDMQLH